MLPVAYLLAIAFTVVCSVITIVTLSRHPGPVLDGQTSRRLARALNRGSLPQDEPDRSVARQLADSRARLSWLALTSVGGAVIALLSPRVLEVFDARLWWAVAACGLLAAAANAFTSLMARRALASA